MKMIINNGQNLLGLVNKMLNLSKLESGKMKLDLRQADVVQLLRNIVESFRSYAAKKEIQMHFLPEIEKVMMDFDLDKLQQIISNLISNAFKFIRNRYALYIMFAISCCTTTSIGFHSMVTSFPYYAWRSCWQSIHISRKQILLFIISFRFSIPVVLKVGKMARQCLGIIGLSNSTKLDLCFHLRGSLDKWLTTDSVDAISIAKTACN